MIRCGREPHSCQALVESKVPAQAVPLWGHGEMDQSGVTAVNGSIQMCESAVKVACPAAKDRALHRRRTTLAWRHAFEHINRQPSRS